jgi:hypothetical protein
MEYDRDKVDEYTLALLFLVMHDEKEHGAWSMEHRAWSMGKDSWQQAAGSPATKLGTGGQRATRH